MQEAHWINPEYEGAIEAAGLADADRICNWSGGKRMTRRQYGWMVRDTVAGIGVVYIKWYGSARGSLRDRFIGSRARREWVNSRWMSRLGMAQPELVSVGTRGGRLLVDGSYFVTQEAPGAVSLQDWLADGERSQDEASLKELGEALVTLIETMQEGGFCHWDLKIRNVLMAREQGRLQLMPIDATNGRRIGWWNRRHCRERDYRFVLRDERLRPYVTAAREALAAK